MRTSIISILFFTVFFGSFHASAETLPEGQAINHSSTTGKYLLSKDFYQLMYALAQEADRIFGMSCDGKYEIKPLRVVVNKTIELPDGAPHATAGMWSYRFDAVRCNATKRYNLMMIAQSGSAPRPRMLLSGNTMTSPLLASDALKAVVGKAVNSLGRNCKDIYAIDTEVTEPPHTVTEKGKTFQGVWEAVAE